jgi:YidC/Oxa1 family membrane protein insertase
VLPVQAAAVPPDDGWLAPISNGLTYSLGRIQTGLDALHVPYSYGWSIVVLTLGTKILTFPLTKIQARWELS